MGAYSASKFALEAISDSLRGELRPWKIHVALVEPGPIETPIWKKSMAVADELVAQAAAQDSLALPERYRRAGVLWARLSARHRRSIAWCEPWCTALTTERPRIRYFLGFRVRFLFKGFRMAPEKPPRSDLAKGDGAFVSKVVGKSDPPEWWNVTPAAHS